MYSIIAWNVGGAFVNPKNKTDGSNSPLAHENAAFHRSSGLMSTLLYPHRTSSFVKMDASPMAYNNSDTNGSGCASFTLHSSKSRSPSNRLRAQSTFCPTQKNRDAISDFDVTIK